MIAEIETNIRAVSELKTQKGILYILRCEGQDRNKVPYMFDVLSAKNTRKVGVQKIRVNLSNRKTKEGQILLGFKIWEVTE
jgi:hypothetical protein